MNINRMTEEQHEVISEINRACQKGEINWMRRQELVLKAAENPGEARVQLYIETGATVEA